MNSRSLERDYGTKAPVKIAKDKNGIGLVTLQNPRGFSAQVIFCFYSYLIYISLFKSKQDPQKFKGT